MKFSERERRKGEARGLGFRGTNGKWHLQFFLQRQGFGVLERDRDREMDKSRRGFYI